MGCIYFETASRMTFTFLSSVSIHSSFAGVMLTFYTVLVVQQRNRLHVYIYKVCLESKEKYGAHTISFKTFYVQTFKIVVDSFKIQYVFAIHLMR